MKIILRQDGFGRAAAGWAPIFAASHLSRPTTKRMARGPIRVFGCVSVVIPPTPKGEKSQFANEIICLCDNGIQFRIALSGFTWVPLQLPLQGDGGKRKKVHCRNS